MSARASLERELPRGSRGWLALLAIGLAAGPAFADEAPAAPTPAASPAVPPASATTPASPTAITPAVEERLRALEEKNAQLEDSLAQLREDHDHVDGLVRQLLARVHLSGYVDFGLFYVTGNGSGIRPDTGHMYFPEYTDVPDSWVFMGDPLSTMVNSRGDVADTGGSRAITLDPIHNGGKLSFIANALNLALFVGVTEHLTLNAMVDFVPRSRDVSIDADSGPMYGSTTKNPSALGDYIDIKLAYLEYRVPMRLADLELYVGKMDSTLGIEYRWQESPDRITVTPSLICRYTCGRPLGVKARLRFADDLFVVAIAVTNGSNMVEYFPFYDEIDTNFFKTVSARISTKLPVGSGLEIGASGAFGAQDFQPADDVWQWHYGFDLHLDVHGFDLRGEFVQGEAEGKDNPGEAAGTCGAAPCLYYKGAYGQAAYRVFNWLIPYVRVDWRNALHRSGDSFVYITDELRVTGGVRLDIGSSVIVKAEYTRNQHLERVPQFNNDVATASVVVKY